jgi:hypothetical protein
MLLTCKWQVIPDSIDNHPRHHFFSGTFAPFLRASDKPIAIACFLLVTFSPLRPLFSFPSFISCISVCTCLLAAAPYFLPADFLAPFLTAFFAGDFLAVDFFVLFFVVICSLSAPEIASAKYKPQRGVVSIEGPLDEKVVQSTLHRNPVAKLVTIIS